MKGFILAAGLGSRLAPVTNEVPKPLLPVGNLPLVHYAILMLRHFGIVDLVINTHHLAPFIEQALGDGAALGVKIQYSRETELLGTGGALKAMHEVLTEPFVVVNSDVIIDLDLNAVLAHHQRVGALATMVLRPSPSADLARIETDETGRIVRLFAHGEPIAAAKGGLQPYMFTGVHVIEPRFLEYLPEGIPTCVVHYGYAKALANGEMLYGALCDGFWTDAGTPEDYLAANAAAIARGFVLPYADPVRGYALAPRREVSCAVRLGHDVLLGTQAHLEPPVVVGDRTKLGDRARVGPDTVVGRDVVLGKDSDVQQSVVLDGARIEPGAKLAHAIVGKTQRLNVRGQAPE